MLDRKCGADHIKISQLRPAYQVQQWQSCHVGPAKKQFVFYNHQANKSADHCFHFDIPPQCIISSASSFVVPLFFIKRLCSFSIDKHLTTGCAENLVSAYEKNIRCAGKYGRLKTKIDKRVAPQYSSAMFIVA